MKYTLDTQPEAVFIGLSRWGRFTGALLTALFAAFVSLVFMAVFYIPDVLADYSKRANFFDFFIGYMLTIAGLVAGVALVLRLLGDYRFELRMDRRQASWTTRTVTGRTIEEELGLEHVVGVRLKPGSGVLDAGRVELELTGGESALVADKRLGREELQTIHEALRACLEADTG